MADNSGMVRLTGLWKNTSKKGEGYLAGSISDSSKLLILPNDNKEKASDPDFIAFIAQQEKKAKPKASKDSFF